MEASLRELPGADRIEDLIKTNNLKFVMQTRKEADTGLLFAIWFGNRDYAVRLLNAFEADPNSSDFKGRTGNLAIWNLIEFLIQFLIFQLFITLV